MTPRTWPGMVGRVVVTVGLVGVLAACPSDDGSIPAELEYEACLDAYRQWYEEQSVDGALDLPYEAQEECAELR